MFSGHTLVAKTLGYNAPELDTCHQSPKSDVYACGVIKLFCPGDFGNLDWAYDESREDHTLVRIVYIAWLCTIRWNCLTKQLGHQRLW